MKRFIVFFCLLISFTVAGTLYADEIIWGSMYGTRNLSFGGDVAVEKSGSSTQLSVYPEAEMLLWKPIMGEFAFIDVGAAAKGRVGIPLPGSDFSLGAGLSGTFHAGFRGLDIPGDEYIGRIDFFAQAGIKFDFITSDSGFGFAAKSGVNYFISDSLAVGLYGSYWGGYAGGGISVRLKLGETPDVKGISLAMPDATIGFAVQPYLLQFYTLYYSAHFAGGFYPGNYKPGQSSVHRISSVDSSGTVSYTVEKALLSELDDGKRLWGLEYSDDEESFYYEYITGDSDIVETVFYKTEDNEIISLDADTAVNPEAEYLTWDDYGAEGRPDVEIIVEAGTFITTEYSYTDDTGFVALWWFSDAVPGGLVSYKMEDGSDIVTSELIDINSRKKPVLYKGNL